MNLRQENINLFVILTDSFELGFTVRVRVNYHIGLRS